MFRGHRVAIATIGLAFALAIAVATWLFSEASRLQLAYEHQAAQNAQQYRDATSVNIQRRCASVPGDQLANCATEQRDAAREGERKEYDLQAQLVTSAWTRAMGVAAIIGMAFGILGVGLVYTTFREASHANTIARESMEGQLRPWITFSVSTAGRFEIVDDHLELMTRVTFENIGQSPAIDLTYMGTMVFGEEIDPQFRRLIEAFRVGDHDWADKNLFPARQWERRVGAVHVGNRDRKTRVTLVIIARYRTPFSDKYRFTARAFEAQVSRQTPSGGREIGAWEVDLQLPDGWRGCNLVEKQHFSGYAT